MHERGDELEWRLELLFRDLIVGKELQGVVEATLGDNEGTSIG